MLKVDVFVLKQKLYDQTAFARRHREDFGEGKESRTLFVTSPEDVILYKLDWYRHGGHVAERQWTDVLGVLKVQHGSIDRAYMRTWAEALLLDDLLLKAFKEAGLD